MKNKIKVGDKIIVKKTFSNAFLSIVQHITPTGLIKLENGVYYNSNFLQRTKNEYTSRLIRYTRKEWIRQLKNEWKFKVTFPKV